MPDVSSPASTGTSDPELIAATRAGDTTAYAALYERHVHAARRLARALTPDAALADDLVSETFAKLLTVLRDGKGPDLGFRPYLLRSLRNTFYDRIRRDKRIEYTDDLSAHEVGQPQPDPAIEGQDRRYAASAYSKLPERWQMVLWHTEVEEDSPADVASLLGMTANGVSALAYRARERLRQLYLQEHIADAPSPQCGWTVDRLGARVRGSLAARDVSKVDHHLDDCAACKVLFMELTEVNSGLRGVLAPVILGAAAPAYLAGASAKTAGIAFAGFFAAIWEPFRVVANWVRRIFQRLGTRNSVATGGATAAVVAGLIALALVSNDAPPPPTESALPPAEEEAAPPSEEEPEEEPDPAADPVPDPEPEPDEPIEEPTEEPVEEPPAEEQPPAEDPPAEQPPAEEPPVEEAPPANYDVHYDLAGANLVAGQGNTLPLELRESDDGGNGGGRIAPTERGTLPPDAADLSEELWTHEPVASEGNSFPPGPTTTESQGPLSPLMEPITLSDTTGINAVRAAELLNVGTSKDLFLPDPRPGDFIGPWVDPDRGSDLPPSEEDPDTIEDRPEPEPDRPYEETEPEPGERNKLRLTLEVPTGFTLTGSDASDGWECDADGALISCVRDSLEPGQGTTAQVPIGIEPQVSGYQTVTISIRGAGESQATLRVPVAPPGSAVGYASLEATGVAMAGNTLLNCLSFACQEQALLGWNDDFPMGPYVPGHGDPRPPAGRSKHAASGAHLAIPDGARVEWAGLYWAGSDNSLPDSVSFAGPSGSWLDLGSHHVRNAGPFGQAFVDVTAQVSGGGEYWVAADPDQLPGCQNVKGNGHLLDWSDWNQSSSSTCQGHSAGWGLTVVYSQPGSPQREIAVYDAPQYLSGHGLDIYLRGGGPVDVGYLLWGGSRAKTKDYMDIGGIPVGQPGNVAYSRSASALNHSNWWYTFGVDADHHTIVAPPGPQDLTVHPGNDEFALGVIALATPPED
ncbi:sigma-70 family RNA polymerase sigma factor [Natronoglycomyces albus]|uniref:Sigma-70 family RNA polymerase sigma factor n=1 Tax=Natronoglycomyces albus TaxID=2811108 RepID=A0A895XQD5_9ACTN|nr:sigma-70 family RNA polymerase sigma factor [Natronoglycomyces albus]QSB05922.1 sigma-70 family RNA polymerase sigma factor [Natronoglycomyces albus]